ncbi:MAG: hypothetical protein JKY56_18710 [Kofleriaceae bacterium]|nr:hypothetical protein [Kofleriaceae bacterium]
MIGDADIRYVVLLTHTQPARIDEELVRSHVAYLQQLEEKGLLELCGPFPENAGGMLVLRVANAEEAHSIAQADPFISSGAQSYMLRRWELSHQGNNHMGMGRK